MQITTLSPQVDKECYERAAVMRLAAERSKDPEKYAMAAAEFTALGMHAAAEACQTHARYYQARQEVPA